MQLISDRSTIFFEDNKIENNQLRENIENVYGKLREVNLLSNKIIALFLDRSDYVLYLIQSFLASDSCYLPIDTTLPFERVKLILENSNVDCIITNKKYKEYFANEDISIFFIEDWMSEFKQKKKKSMIDFPNTMGKGEAYILFTSGTTGSPKGVIISKKSLMNFIKGSKEELDLSGCNRILCTTSISFDIFHFECVFALHIGLSVAIANELEHNNPRAIIKLIQKYEIDIFQCTPSRMQQLLSMDPTLDFLEGINCIVIGGEKLPDSLVERIKQRKNIRLYNAYGPTEATIWISYRKIEDKNDIDIGKPMINNKFYFINEKNILVDEGEAGEICIAGENIFDGYIRDMDLTNEKKITIHTPNPIIAYRTGDKGYKKKDGNTVLLGRIDNQVKVNGFRIELEEIEINLERHSDVIHAVAFCERNCKLNRNFIVLLYSSIRELEVQELRKWLLKYVPMYMIPSKFIWVRDFRYTIGGKVDRVKMKQMMLDMQN